MAALMLALLVFGYLLPATGYFTAVPGDLGDSRFNNVILEHLYQVVQGRAELWNPRFYYPYPGALAFSDNHLGSGVTYVLARVLGLSRQHAQDAWFILGNLLNFTSMLYVLRRLGVSMAAAALGAFFFTFALPVPPHDIHPQLVHRFASPFAVLALWRLFEQRRLIYVVPLAVFTVWQFYCSIYLGLFLVYLLTALAVAIMIQRRPPGWREWRDTLRAEHRFARIAGGVALIVSAIAFLYLGGNYYRVSEAYGLARPMFVITELLPRPASYLIADASPLVSWLGSRFEISGSGEHQLFIGFGPLILLAVAAAATWRRRMPALELSTAMLIALATLFLGTLCIHEQSLYQLIAWLPGIDGIRAVARIMLMMLVPISVLIALAADLMLRTLGQTRVARLGVLALLVALVSTEPLSLRLETTPIAAWETRLRTVKDRLPKTIDKDAILMVRTSSKELPDIWRVELDAMMLGQELGHPVMNGYSGFYPPGYWLQPCPTATQPLRGYFMYMHGTIRMSDYAQRLVIVDLEPCPSAFRPRP